MIKKVAAIHDLSGVGRCSLTVAIPILSALKIQCCPFPTAILSAQTGYPNYSFFDLTNLMNDYKDNWNELNIEFDCIYSGFLGSIEQIDIVSDFIKKNKSTLVVIDPVMGDDGSLYPVFNNEMCTKIKNLVKNANIVTPNLTEALILTDKDYTNTNLKKEELLSLARDVSTLGPSKVIITGIIIDDKIHNLAFDKDLDEFYFTSSEFNNISYSGTGDIFTSILTGLLLNGESLNYSIIKASNFIHKTVLYTSQFKTDRNDGVMFEMFLSDLIK
ncbi:pyridoxamine kinase [Paraclostridium sordellii]|uniref:pyridoxamine kinase n=1 Tax=Paraclostridium sordellii TaxID=1505 RepID=UPI001F0629F3|nr:pyridoxamine kinase [Paeniclostridium sordellii]MCH1965848.1 pyridoxamine kinase [Paeniclostridium sordellii]